MWPLILMCIILLAKHQCADLTEDNAGNDTIGLHQISMVPSPESDVNETRYHANFHRTTSEYDTTDETPSVIFRYNTSVHETKDKSTSNNNVKYNYSISRSVEMATTSDINLGDKILGFNTNNVTFSIDTSSDVTSRSRQNELFYRYATTEFTNTGYTTKYNDSSEGHQCKMDCGDDQEDRFMGEENKTPGLQDETDVESEYSTMWYTIVFVIGFVGIVCNVCLSLVFILRKGMRTSSNLMIINLTISDLLFFIVNISLVIVQRFSTSWLAGEFLCKFCYWVRYLIVGTSIYSIVTISLQRFFALSTLFRANVFDCMMRGKYKPFLVVFIVWTLAGALALKHAEYAHLANLFCYPVDPRDKSLRRQKDIVDFVVYCAMPLFIIASSSVAISIRLKKSAENMPGEISANRDPRRKRVVSSNVLLALTVVFALSYVPTFVYYLYLSWNEAKYDVDMDYAFYVLFFANSCFNPIALFIMSRKYRRIFVEVICRKKSAWKSRNISEISTVTIVTKL